MNKNRSIPWYRAILQKSNSNRDLRDFALSVPIFLKWLGIGAMIGLIVGVVGVAFAYTLAFVNGVRADHPWLLLGLPFGGLVIVFLYRFFKNTDDKGTNTVVASIQSSSQIPTKMAPLVFISTAITHLFGGSSGREGAALQLGGSIAKRLGIWLKLDENGQRTIIMCGMSAGFSALFGTPMAAAIFSIIDRGVGSRFFITGPMFFISDITALISDIHSSLSGILGARKRGINGACQENHCLCTPRLLFIHCWYR
jgi:H+/Cl- antiporter ClcA